MTRHLKDFKAFHKDPPSGLYLDWEEANPSNQYAIMVGPVDTPYSFGVFSVKMVFPTEYPLKPPTCTWMTTNFGKYRFNPNLYSSGKICLSILGTFPGPSWTPLFTTTVVLNSIRSLMGEIPIQNEPAYENLKDSMIIQAHQAEVFYMTMEIAIVGRLESVNHDIKPPQANSVNDAISRHIMPNTHNIIRIAKDWDTKLPFGIQNQFQSNGLNGRKFEPLIVRLIAAVNALDARVSIPILVASSKGYLGEVLRAKSDILIDIAVESKTTIVEVREYDGKLIVKKVYGTTGPKYYVLDGIMLYMKYSVM